MKTSTNIQLINLKHLYHQWNGSNDSLEQLKIIAKALSLEFKEILIEFKQYINDPNTDHPCRYGVDINYLYASYCSESYAFKKLNQTLDNLINDKEDQYSFDIRLYEMTVNAATFAWQNKLFTFAIVAVPLASFARQSIIHSETSPTPEKYSFYSDPALKAFNDRNFYYDSECFAPYWLNQKNSFSVFGSSFHFTSKLVCNNCDGDDKGKKHFFADFLSVSQQGKHVRSLRDNPNYIGKYYLRYKELEISPKEAERILKAARAEHGRSLSRPKIYSLDRNGETCVTAIQDFYSQIDTSPAAFTDGIGKEYLTGPAGAFAFFQQHPITLKNIWTSLSIWAQTPKKQVVADEWEPTIRPCEMIPGARLFDKYYPCKATPTGQLIPVGYESSFEPAAEYHDNGTYVKR